MPFLMRVAPIATIAFAFALLTGVGTPGFAKDIALNVSTALPVPVSLSAMTVQQAPSATLPLPNAATTSATNLVGTRPGDTVAFGTLAAAVAAQPTSQALGDTMGEDLACMAGAIYFEAKGEPLSGQLAVAEVILNRTKSGRFPKSVCSVVTQPGQFSFVRGGRIPSVAQNRQYQTAVAVARVALGDMWDSPAADAMYFHARRVSPSWGHKTVATIGNHIFYR